MKQTEILTHATHVNGWFPAVYMSCMSQNFRLFHVSNLSVRNFRIFLLMYTGSMVVLRTEDASCVESFVYMRCLNFCFDPAANQITFFVLRDYE